MKVLQVNSVCGIGSTGRIVREIYDLLESEGEECIIAYGRKSQADKIRTIRIGTDFDNYFNVVTNRLFDNQGFSSTKATEQFITKVKEYNPDIIHLHNIHGYYINLNILFKYIKESNKPIIWTLHDCWAFTGHCAYFDYVKCEKWKTRCFDCPQKHDYPASFCIDNSANNYIAKMQLFSNINNLTIVTPSAWLAGIVKQSFLADYPIKVINNGIDLDTFRPTESKFRQKYGLEDIFIILGVANVWDRRKGLSDFIELNKRLKHDEKIVIIGLTSKQIETLPNGIIGISRTCNVAELASIYSTADVFFNPTYEDNFPTTNLESIACGTPVITYDTGGSPESVNEQTGAVVKKGDIECVLEVIRLKCKTGKYSRTTCVASATHYNKTNRFNEYIEYMHKILDNSEIVRDE